MNEKDWQARDAQVNWHPYTQQQTADPPLVIHKGKGSILEDVNGKKYIDAIASWWSNPHGHANPYLVKKITQQLQKLEHVVFSGITHPPAIELSEKLLALLPNQSRVFYSDNGSTSIEVALKMSLQYFENQGIKRKGIIALEEAYHGDTFGAMASSGVGLYTRAFSDYLLPVRRLPLPTDENIEEVCGLLSDFIKQEKPFAFIFEALVQGAAGMRMFSPKHLDRMIKICHENQILCIADEVMTGFGKTGKLFASDHLNEKPDIHCFSKALTSGFIPMSATTCTAEIYNAFLSDSSKTTFFHGHTFTAYPTGCAAALASLELTLAPETQKKSTHIETRHKAFADRLRLKKGLKNIGQMGIILRFAFDKPELSETDIYGDFRNMLYRFYIEKGVLLRPLGNVVYILPPHCITDDELDKVYEVVLESVEKFASN